MQRTPPRDISARARSACRKPIDYSDARNSKATTHMKAATTTSADVSDQDSPADDAAILSSPLDVRAYTELQSVGDELVNPFPAVQTPVAEMPQEAEVSPLAQGAMKISGTFERADPGLDLLDSDDQDDSKARALDDVDSAMDGGGRKKVPILKPVGNRVTSVDVFYCGLSIAS